MSAHISFEFDHWDAESSAVAFAMEFLAEQLPAGAARDQVANLLAHNICCSTCVSLSYVRRSTSSRMIPTVSRQLRRSCGAPQK